MAEPDTTTAPDPQEQYIQQMLRQLQAPPPVATGGRSRTEAPSSITGLLGSALGGGPSGSVPMSADEADASGNRALLNFGLNLLANSGYRTDRPTIGQLIGGGIGAAQQSLGQSEYMKAARGQAQQDYAAQQQELQIARIKEALPLLNLQDEIQRARRARALLGPSASNTNIGAAGSQTASAEVPPELMPHYEAASRETGIPVAVLIAKDKQESGFNNSMPNGGIAQVLPSTAAAPGFGVPPISQAELADPGKNIMFGARYLKARGDAAGVKDWNNPDDIGKALLAYNGGGDKNYVANVMRYYKPGTTAPATTAAKPGTPASPAQPIPATDASGGTTAEAAPAPGRAQFAGPGAPPDATAPPPSPGAAGNADAIAAGMIARGADPTTLAPTGRGVTADEVTAATAGPAAPTVPPGPVVPAPATPPVAQAVAPEAQRDQPDIKLGNGGIIRHPGTPADFRARNYQPPPTTEDFNPNLTEAENAGFARRRAALAMDRKLLDTVPRAQVPAAVKALNDQESALDVDYQTALQGKRAKADAKLTEWNQKQDADLRPLYQDAVKAYDTAAQSTLASSNAIAEKDAEQEGTYVSGQRKELADGSKAARESLDDLHMLRLLSEAAGTSTALDNIEFRGRPARDWLASLGAGTKEQRDKWDAQQAFVGAKNALVLSLRKGNPMGSLSDRDMQFLSDMGPDLFKSPQARASIISTLELAQGRKLEYATRVQQMWNGGKRNGGTTWGDAVDRADAEFKERPLIATAPKDYDSLPPEKKTEWFQKNVPPGTLFRDHHGDLRAAPTGVY